MNIILLYLLKSTLCMSVLYLVFRTLMRKQAFFQRNRAILLSIVVFSAIIPLVNLPQTMQTDVSFQLAPVTDKIVEYDLKLPGESALSGQVVAGQPMETTSQQFEISWPKLLQMIYLSGLFTALLASLIGFLSILILFRKVPVIFKDGYRLMIAEDDIPAFSLGRYLFISKGDFETNGHAILTHEKAHMQQGHFYDLLLLEVVKIIYWFNPVIYWLTRDLKAVHEFQADDSTLNNGIDATQYQLLIIQKGVGHQKFALANSFNHCQIKNRIVMMNKQKSNKAWSWTAAAFLPILALLLMAFGRTGENVSEKISQPEKGNAPLEILQNQNEQTSRLIEIKTDGNYIDNNRSSLEEIVKKGQEWGKTSNDWIHLQIDQSIPYNRIDEIRERLEASKVYHVTQSTVNSNEIIYPAGDVSETAKFTQGKWSDWSQNQLNHFSNGKSKTLEYKITISFIIDKKGKVRDAHIVKGSEYPEINEAMEKVLAQVPDWIPAKRGDEAVSVLAHYVGRVRIVKPDNKN